MKTLFDNYNHDSKCQSLWGFSTYLEEHNLLFDTGRNGRVLLKNMAQLNVNIKEKNPCSKNVDFFQDGVERVIKLTV